MPKSHANRSVRDPGFFEKGTASQTGGPKCQEAATFFGRGTSYILDSEHIILTGATAGSERAPQGFMLSIQSSTIYCCVGGLCGAPLHGSWVLVGLKLASHIALSGVRRLTAPVTGQLKGRHFAGGGGRPPPPAPGSAPEIDA